MTYELAVWDGPPPLSNAHAASECHRLVEARSSSVSSPVSSAVSSSGLSPAIEAFVEALLAVYPDLDRPGGASSPWSDGPLLAYADGPLLYFGVKPEHIDDVVDLVEQTAKRMELVAYDPQLSQLMPSAVTIPRTADFELPSAEEFPLHLRALMGEALNAGKAMAGVLEQVETGYYLQWMASGGALAIEVQGDASMKPEHRLSKEGHKQMLDLGFAAGEPNWRLAWADGPEHLEDASRILTTVVNEVRALRVGTPMALQTFPVPT